MNDEIILKVFSERLFKLIKQNDTDINILAKQMGIKSKSTIYRYMNGEMSPKITTVKYLAEYYNVNPVWLMGYDVPMEKDDNKYYSYSEPESEHLLCLAEKGEEYSYSSSYTIPLLGIVKAGYNYLASENIIGYVSTDKKISDLENYFALKVTGNSMEPILYEGDIVLIHKQNDIESGQVGIVLIDNEEATVKKIIKHEDYIELIAFNSYYPPKKLDDKCKFSIIGRVTEARISKIFE